MSRRMKFEVKHLAVFLCCAFGSACGDSDSSDGSEPGGSVGGAGSSPAVGGTENSSGSGAASSGAASSGGSDASAGGGGTSSAGGEQGIGGGLAHDESRAGACFAYASAVCALSFSCYADQNFDESFQNDCQYSGDTCPDVVFSEGSTRTVEGLYACVDEFRDFPCDSYRRGFLPDCVTPGTKKEGEACVVGSQCESLHCSGQVESACGVCQGFAADEDDCNEEELTCAPGSECSSSGECLEVGTECGGGVTCLSDQGCDEETGRCRPKAKAGGECAVPNDCEEGLACNADGICQALGDEGDSCVGGLPCALDLVCNETCMFAPGLGDSCEQALACSTEAYCKQEDLTCRAFPQEGEGCGVDTRSSAAHHCEGGLRCDTEAESPICRPLDFFYSSAGEICGGDTESICLGGLTCLCDDDECSLRHCSQRLQLGSSCPDDVTAHCREGTVCESGVCIGLESTGLFEKLCQP